MNIFVFFVPIFNSLKTYFIKFFFVLFWSTYITLNTKNNLGPQYTSILNYPPVSPRVWITAFFDLAVPSTN